MENRLTFKDRLALALGGILPADAKRIADERVAAVEKELIDADARATKAYGFGFDDGIDTGHQEAVERGANAEEPGISVSDGGVMSLGYRSSTAARRDLSSVSQERAIDAAYRLWNTHPLAKALTEIVVDYVIGDGVVVQAVNEDVQAVVEDFLEDPVNQLDGLGLEQLTREIGLFGEQLVLLFVKSGRDVGGTASGLLRYGTVDPSEIQKLITRKGNPKDIIAVQVKGKGADGPIYKVVQSPGRGEPYEGVEDYKEYATLVAGQKDDDPRLTETEIAERMDQQLGCLPRIYDAYDVAELAGGRMIPDKEEFHIQEATEKAKYDGQCFLFQVNKISTGFRGRPDMLPLLDWLDRFDQLFFDGAEHVSILNMFAWHLVITGGSETSPDPETNLKVQLNKVAKLKSNSVFASNEKVELEAKNPDLKTYDLQAIIRQLRILIAGGARVPEHWIAEGGYTNRATAEEMGQPTYRMLTRRQQYVQNILAQMVRFQIDVKVALGKLSEEVPVKTEGGQETGDKIKARDAFEITMPDINVSNTRTAAVAFELVARSVVALRSQGVLPNEQAVALIAAMAELVGVDINVEQVLEEIGYGVPDSLVPGLLDDEDDGDNQDPFAKIAQKYGDITEGDEDDEDER